jgi:N-acetyl-alpha-D-muramate 1-phosphate uridylyltransferase
MSLPIAVLAGGLATRLGPLTARQPKVLIDVGGRPFAEHLIELFARRGLRDVVWCVGHLGEQVRPALGDGSRWSMSFRYAFDGPGLTGTGGALLGALPLLGPAFFVTYGDAYLECDYAAVEAAFCASGLPGLMTVFRNEDRWDRSNVRVENGRIVRYDKQRRDPGMRHIDYGLSVLTDEALAPWLGSADPFDLAVVFQALIGRDALAACEIAARFYEIGSPEGLAETRALLAGRQRTTG